MGTSAAHHSNPPVADSQVLAPDVLDQLTATWGVTDQVANEMFARLSGPDYRRWEARATRCGFCAHPVRLTGRVVDGDGAIVFDSRGEPDGVLLKRCGNRRRSVCPSCSFLYAGDMWHLLFAGLAGGDKGVPPGVHAHPMVFATLTAPSFGPVHSTRQRNGKPQRCRPRREGQLCPHGRRLWCMAIHDDHDPKVGAPICPDCYHYPAAVLFNWHAPELWRRFTIDLYRTLAAAVGLSEADLKDVVRVSYAKVAEAQQRGVVHFHAIIRLDAAGDGWEPPGIPIPVEVLGDAVRQAAQRTTLAVATLDGQRLRLRFGTQIDVQPIAHRPDLAEGELGPEKVAAYISKYACKGPDDFGIVTRRITPDTARALGLPDHHLRMIDAATQLSRLGGCERLALWTHAFGFRGHFATHSRRYSTSLTALRAARADHASRHNRRHPEAREHDDDLLDVLAYVEPDDDTTVLVGEWRFAGIGYTTDGDAKLAALSEADAREWRPYIAQAVRDQKSQEPWINGC